MYRLNLTSRILDKLGFSPYWDEHVTWGSRTLTFSNGIKFSIIEYEEMDDDTGGYADGMYVANRFQFAGWFVGVDGDYDLFFLHEMYECIEKYYPSCLEEFVEKCTDLKMNVYIDECIKEQRREKRDSNPEDDCEDFIRGEANGQCWSDRHYECINCQHYREDFKRLGEDYVNYMFNPYKGIIISSF